MACTLKKLLFIVLVCVTFWCEAPARNVFRTPDPLCPQITTKWTHNSKTYTLQDSHLEYYPIFAWKADQLKNDLLPDAPITHKDAPSKTSSGAELKRQVEELLDEIEAGKKSFKNFSPLKVSNFSVKKKCGLLVLKFKDHPFVLKLFMETPKTFADPYCKGIEPTSFFFMGGGCGRHVSGLTRILNAKLTRKRIEGMNKWCGRVDMPRKWFWTPKNNQTLHLFGTNVGGFEHVETTLPGTYAIIADEIKTEKKLPVKKRIAQHIIMDLCNDLDLHIDPHEDNFLFIKDPATKQIQLTIIDTEHFPTFVGLKKKRKFKSHRSWFAFLVTKCAKDMWGRTKSTRRYAQIEPRELDII